MKKWMKLVSLVLLLTVLFTFTGCKKARENYDKKTFDASTVATTEVKEGYTFVGYYQMNEENKKATLYLPGSTIPAGEYELMFVENSKVALDGKYSYPSMVESGFTFAGWYTTENLKQGSRVAVSGSDATILYARYITLGDAGLVALVCILIVFSMLALLWGIVSLFKFFAPKEKVESAKITVTPKQNAPQKAFTMADITDEDMMVAALVASIDYRNQTKENVRVVSIKQIG